MTKRRLLVKASVQVVYSRFNAQDNMIDLRSFDYRVILDSTEGDILELRNESFIYQFKANSDVNIFKRLDDEGYSQVDNPSFDDKAHLFNTIPMLLVYKNTHPTEPIAQVSKSLQLCLEKICAGLSSSIHAMPALEILTSKGQPYDRDRKIDMCRHVTEAALSISSADCTDTVTNKLVALHSIFRAMSNEALDLCYEENWFLRFFWHKPQNYQDALLAVKTAVLTILKADNESNPHGAPDPNVIAKAKEILGTHRHRFGFGTTRSIQDERFISYIGRH